MAVAPRGVEAQLVALAVALEAEPDGAVGGDVELGVVALDGGEAAVVLEGDGAGEDGVAGVVDGQAGLGAPAHDVVVFDVPAGEAFGAAELDEGAVGRRGGGGPGGTAEGAAGDGEGEQRKPERGFHAGVSLWRGFRWVRVGTLRATQSQSQG